MPDRAYEFELNQAVTLKISGMAGKVIARSAEPDVVLMVDVTGANIKRFEGRRLGDKVQVAVPVNAYQVAFIGENDRPDTAWWHGDMLVKA